MVSVSVEPESVLYGFLLNIRLFLVGKVIVRVTTDLVVVGTASSC
jgi:hypothetical protein